ncbi:MAG: HAD family hydrolase [Galactobacter sp.]
MHAPDRTLSGRPLPAPGGILLDFGGVIAETATREGWIERLADRVGEKLGSVAGACDGLSRDRIVADIAAGARADSYWKNAMSRPLHAQELRADQFWGDFVGGDWPTDVRATVIDFSRELCIEMVRVREERTLRAGIHELVGQAQRRGINVGIVSNTLAGSVYRAFIDEVGLSSLLQAQVYSDEAGVRKPDPDVIRAGADALSIDVASCWYVGDNFDRDVLCGHRAAVGGNVLMESSSTWDLPYEIAVRPDVIVADPSERGKLLARVCDDEVG